MNHSVVARLHRVTTSTARPLALVTGVCRGVGAATARALGPTHDLLLGGRDGDALAGRAGAPRRDGAHRPAGGDTSTKLWRSTIEVNVVGVAAAVLAAVQTPADAHPTEVVLCRTGSR